MLLTAMILPILATPLQSGVVQPSQSLFIGVDHVARQVDQGAVLPGDEPGTFVFSVPFVSDRFDAATGRYVIDPLSLGWQMLDSSGEPLSTPIDPSGWYGVADDSGSVEVGVFDRVTGVGSLTVELQVGFGLFGRGMTPQLGDACAAISFYVGWRDQLTFTPAVVQGELLSANVACQSSIPAELITIVSPKASPGEVFYAEIFSYANLGNARTYTLRSDYPRIAEVFESSAPSPEVTVTFQPGDNRALIPLRGRAAGSYRLSLLDAAGTQVYQTPTASIAEGNVVSIGTSHDESGAVMEGVIFAISDTNPEFDVLDANLIDPAWEPSTTVDGVEEIWFRLCKHAQAWSAPLYWDNCSAECGTASIDIECADAYDWGYGPYRCWPSFDFCTKDKNGTELTLDLVTKQSGPTKDPLGCESVSKTTSHITVGGVTTGTTTTTVQLYKWCCRYKKEGFKKLTVADCL